jgi:hypothetical protein
VTTTSPPHPMSQLIRRYSFKDDITIILLLGLFFMLMPLPNPCQSMVRMLPSSAGHRLMILSYFSQVLSK